MRLLRKLLDAQGKMFQKGGKLEKFYPMFEAMETLAFTTGKVNKGTVHVRDGLDLKRMMITVVVALMPIVVFAMYNTGYQSHLAMAEGAVPLDVWQNAVFGALGLQHTTAFLPSFVYGALFFLPVFIVGFAVGGGIEVVFAIIRKHEVNEGFFVTGFLLPLTLPPTIPLWQVVLGVAFGVVIGKEIFGGTGMNILNPALTARAFLFFAYPAAISGDTPWLAANFSQVDGFSGATLLSKAAVEPGALGALGSEQWMDSFLGFITGSMGETSALLCLIGAVILILTRIGAWQTMAGVVVGTIGMSMLLNGIGSETNPMFSVPFYWHMVLGGWAFGTVFMATDPVSSAFTSKGKMIYGLGIGTLVVLVRVVNPAYPEGMMLAILFMNLFAPVIDHFFIKANIKRRLARHGA
ncbi:MAG: NADH:ubiquinone reductase (Na(+)-transporting) subunit B [Acidobacteria bacterium]|uniref:Na(+)-translocating NADH-quinone reductase subunit B n=1 Tax=Candidatus Polarisedimenticola svalbardensis TaxID=2886004 RepID=A0A8J6Y2X1_9BACT|nr:NADH:ubiquinone reductase (Na(+)-transporting) subunit B [Candidatus Polarisedimenticola svalbardensis]